MTAVTRSVKRDVAEIKEQKLGDWLKIEKIFDSANNSFKAPKEDRLRP